MLTSSSPVVLKSPQDSSVTQGVIHCTSGHSDPFIPNRKPFIRFFLPFWMGCVCCRSLALHLASESHVHAVQLRMLEEVILGLVHQSACLPLPSCGELPITESFFLIGPLSSPPHFFRVPSYSVRMEYACKPPPWNCSTRALPHSPMWRLWLRNIMLSS